MNNNQNEENLNKWIFIIIAIVSFLLPFIIFGAVYCLNISQIPILYEKKDVLAYYGSIIGTCFTGFITAGGLYFTLYQNTKTFNKQRKIDNKYQEENKYDSVMPILKISENKKQEMETSLYYKCKPSLEARRILFLTIKNIGNGPAMKVKIRMNDFDLTTAVNNVNVFDLGVGETKNIKIFFEIGEVFNSIDERNFSIRLILECNNIYMKRKYEYYIMAIHPKGYGEIDIFTYDGVRISNI